MSLHDVGKLLYIVWKNMTKKDLTDLTYIIIGAAIEVHKILGPGLLESVYQKCFAYELQLREISCCSELYIPVYYKDTEMNTQFRCDLLIEDAIVAELKAVEKVLPIHEAFLINYMKLLEKPKGIMINFNCINIFKEGQKTYVNEFYRNLREE
ncbi:MAG: GxxExxY protein [Ferruginibacter sp.]